MKIEKMEESCFLSIKKIKILHPKGCSKKKLLFVAKGISDNEDIDEIVDKENLDCIVNNCITTEWIES